MARSAHSVVAVAAGALLVVSCAVLVARAGDDGPETAVLGRQVVRTTTTTGVDETTTTTFMDLAVPGSVIVEDTTTTTAGATTTTAHTATTTTSPGEPSGRTVERADTTSSFDYRADGGGTMSTVDNGPPRDPFRFKALGSDVDHNGVAELRSEMANQTDREIRFPDGLVLRFLITRDGKQWRTVELRFPDTQSLPPGGSLEIESATPLDQQYGHFDVTGEVTVEYR